MKEFISDLGVIPSASGPMKIFCDNTGAIALAKESRFHKRTKHIKRRFNSIRDLVQVGDIEICKIRMYLANLYVSLLDLIADGLEASLNVLGSLVKSGFPCQGNCTSIVTKDFHWTRCTRYDT